MCICTYIYIYICIGLYNSCFVCVFIYLYILVFVHGFVYDCYRYSYRIYPYLSYSDGSSCHSSSSVLLYDYDYDCVDGYIYICCHIVV